MAERVRTRVAPEEALERVTSTLGELATEAKLNFGQLDLTAQPVNFVEVMRLLRDTPGLKFEFFTFLTGVDRSAFGDDPQPSLEVLTHVYSPEHVLHANVHVPVAMEAPSCPTITGIFLGAEWAERECHEMFGIDFVGHPNLVHLYLPEDFEGHPLLKSFKLPSRIVKEWPGAKDPDEAAAGGR